MGTSQIPILPGSANLKVLKAWVGEGAWNLNRWAAQDAVPAITKEQLGKLKLKY